MILHVWNVIFRSDHMGGAHLWRCTQCAKEEMSGKEPARAGCPGK